MLIVVVALISAFLSASAIWADECPGSPAEQLQCLAEAYNKSEAALNAAHVKRIEQLTGTERTTFIENELTWTRERYATCRSKASVPPGSAMQPILYQQCMLDMNRQHLQDIQRQLDNKR